MHWRRPWVSNREWMEEMVDGVRADRDAGCARRASRDPFAELFAHPDLAGDSDRQLADLRREVDSLASEVRLLRVTVDLNRGTPAGASGRPRAGNVTPIVAASATPVPDRGETINSRLGAIDAALAEILRRLPPDDGTAGVPAMVR